MRHIICFKRQLIVLVIGRVVVFVRIEIMLIDKITHGCRLLLMMFQIVVN